MVVIGDVMFPINFTSLSVQIQQKPSDIGQVSISLGDNPANWQASFISPTYYPPGTIITLLDMPFIVTSVSKQTSNVYQYRAFLKASLLDMTAIGRVDNTGAYIRQEQTNPYEWNLLDDLTNAYKQTSRNKVNNTLVTPFEKSFDRFTDNITWTHDSIRDALSVLYPNSQTLVIPWYNCQTNKFEWKTISEWLTLDEVTLTDITVTNVDMISRPKGVKIFAKNRFKRAVTMYECPVAISPDHELLDVGFYVMACDGDKSPTVRFTYNYNISFSFLTRMNIYQEWKDDSGMIAQIVEETSDDGSVSDLKAIYWYDKLSFCNNSDSHIYAESFNKLIRLYLKALKFIANPIITFDSQNDYLDSYFPYPISPWNFQLYLKPTNKPDIWIPTKDPYTVYDSSVLSSLPSMVWTGAFCSVVRISTLQQQDSVLNKDIVQQGFYVNGFNVGHTLTPFSLLSVESQTQMPIIASDMITSYLNDISKMPDIPYKVYMVSELQKSLYRYGLTIEQLTSNTNAYPSKTLRLDLTDNSLSLYDSVYQTHEDLKYDVQTYDFVDVYVCYNIQKRQDGTEVVQPRDELDVGFLEIRPPSTSPVERMEKHIIIVFSTAIYFITYRIFASPPFLCAPYVQKYDEDYTQTVTTDYDIVITSDYSSLLSRIGQYVDKSITFEWEGHIDDFPDLLPFRRYNGYVISQVNITIDGDYVKATCTADNRIRLYQKWERIFSDITPQTCTIEIYPRIPNRHDPIPKIYAFSDRVNKVREYLRQILQYNYHGYDPTKDDVDKIFNIVVK